MNAYVAISNNRYVSNVSITSGTGEEKREQWKGERLSPFSGCSISTDVVNYYSTARDRKQRKVFLPETNSKEIMRV